MLSAPLSVDLFAIGSKHAHLALIAQRLKSDAIRFSGGRVENGNVGKMNGSDHQTLTLPNENHDESMKDCAIDRLIASYSNIERFNITGTQFSDTLQGANLDDILIGGAGNDTLTGGAGNDSITGVNSQSTTPGKGEIDNITGGTGRDTFILGDVNWIGYDDGNTTSAGNNDYATIADFNPTDDIIQIRGSSSDYLLTVSGSNTNLYINKPGTEPDELIAVINNQTALSLTASYFSYVSPLSTIEAFGNTKLVQDTTNKLYTQIGNNNPIAIKSSSLGPCETPSSSCLITLQPCGTFKRVP